MASTVLVIVDASHCTETGVGGWAFHIESNLRRIRMKSGTFKRHIPTNSAAEIAAIANAIVYMELAGLLDTYKVVEVKSDCQSALSRLADQPMKACTIAGAAHAVIRDVIDRTGVEVKFTHIQGHQKFYERTREGAIHNRCDRAARSAMRALRDKLKR